MRPMKDSGIDWLGEIPADWRVSKVAYLSRRAKTNARELGVVTAFRDGQVTLRSNRRVEGFTEATEYHGYQLIKKGQLAVHRMDAFAGAIGVSDSEGMCSPVLTILDCNSSMNPWFLALYLREVSKSGWIEALAKSVRERTSEFGWSQLSALFVVIPSTEEQEAIVSYLDQGTSKIDLLISKKEQLIEKLLERRQALMTQVVTQGLDPDVPKKDSGIEWLGRVPKTWDVIPLKRLVKLNPETLNESTEPSEEIHYIEIGNVSLAAGIEGWTAIPYGDAPSRARRVVREGDVLISTVRTYLKAIGRVVSIPTYGKLVASTGFAALRPLGVDSRFLELAIAADSFIGKIQANSVGVSYPGIDASRLISFKIALPPTAEQTVISTYLDTELSQIGKLISRSKSAIDLLRERRQALITQVVTGKLDVRGLSDGDS